MKSAKIQDVTVQPSKPVKQTKNTKPNVAKVKRHRLKETFSELKKVNWPTFAKTMKQTGMVLAIVVAFSLVVLGIDTLVSHIIKVISNF